MVGLRVLPQVSGNLRADAYRPAVATAPPISPWRTGDREIIRGYAAWPVIAYNIVQLTSAMNRVAEASPEAVVQIQAWIDEAESLQQDWADQIGDGTAHIGNATRYEGPAPGSTLTRDDLLKRADVLEWDTTLSRVVIDSGGRADATAGGVLAARIGGLKAQVLQALGIQAAGAWGGNQLLRS